MKFQNDKASGNVLCASFALMMIIIGPAVAEPIKPSPALPSTTPWDLNKLSEPPSFSWEDDNAPVRSLFYEGEPFSGKPTRVFAYYATPWSLKGGTPAGAKSLPGVVLVHGGGGTAFREWVELWANRGYAAIAMDLTGHRPVEGKDANKPENRAQLPDHGPGMGDADTFGNVDLSPHEQWTYHAVAAVIRAHSLLRSFAGVDPGKTAITGISWGGYLTCIVAGLDTRFKAAVPVYGCGFLHENSAWTERLNKLSPVQRDRWVSLWDPSRYLPAVTMPIFFVNGTNDFAYPLDSYMKSYDAVPGEKNIRVTVNMPHGHQAGWAPAEIGFFIDQHLIGGPPLPKLETPSILPGGAGQVGTRNTSLAMLSGTALHFASDDGPINKREWSTVEGTVRDDKARVTDGRSDATVWFMTATDERGAVVSTPVMFK